MKTGTPMPPVLFARHLFALGNQGWVFGHFLKNLYKNVIAAPE